MSTGRGGKGRRRRARDGASLPGRPFTAAGVTLFAVAVGLAARAPALTGGPTTVERGASTRAAAGAAPIPAFSRMYGTACSTCHTAPPKLNVLGEAFRLNGYRPPRSQLLERRDEPVSLGAPEWDEAWPRSILSGEVPGIAPLAVRVVSDAEFTADERKAYDATYRFPHEIHLLAGAPLGDDVSVFLDSGWSPEEGFRVSRAKVQLQDPVPGLPPRALNLWVGLQSPYLLTLGDRHIDRAARQKLSWETFDGQGLAWTPPGGGERVSAVELPALGGSQPAVEANGILGGRLYYGVGVSQGRSDGAVDANGRKDVYYKLRYKLGGLDLTGRYDGDEAPSGAVHGQLLDRALILEHFGYAGSETTPDAPVGGHRAFGLAARALVERIDLGVGWVFRELDAPWPALDAGSVEAIGLFGKAEYIVLPWLIGSVKADRLDLEVERPPAGGTVEAAPGDATRIMPGVIVLLRQNVRVALEGELFLEAADAEAADLSLPHGFWLRLDVAF